MVNEHYEPDSVEDTVIRLLREEGRVNAPLVVAETDLERAAVNHALRDLATAGWCRKVARGLYEYVEDPRIGDTRGADGQRDESERDSGGDPDADPPEIDDEIDAAIDEWVPDGEVNATTARTALREAVAYLATHSGRARKSDIVAGAHDGDSSLQTWWERSAQPGLAMLADAELVERPTNKTYRLESDGE